MERSMIPTPRGWRREVRAHEVRLLPGDNSPARISYVQRFGPLRSARAVARARLEQTPAFTALEIGPVERITTLEDEHAALGADRRNRSRSAGTAIHRRSLRR